MKQHMVQIKVKNGKGGNCSNRRSHSILNQKLHPNAEKILQTASNYDGKNQKINWKQGSNAKDESDIDVEVETTSNTIFIMLDDLGHADIGKYGAESETPNINKFLESSVVLNNYYIDGSLDAGSCNFPLRDGKNAFFEGNVRILAAGM